MISALNNPPLQAALDSNAETPTSVIALELPKDANNGRARNNSKDNSAIFNGGLAALIEAFRRGWGIERVREISGGITRWFLHRFSSLAATEMEVMAHGGSPSDVDVDDLQRWKGAGMTDAHIADALAGFPVTGVRELDHDHGPLGVMECRHNLGIHPVYRMVDSCAAEFAAVTPVSYTHLTLPTIYSV